jgi:hypothetical protein
MSPRPTVRVAGADQWSVVAFVTTDTETDVRVRFRTSGVRCDVHGRMDAPACPHAHAVAALGIDLPQRSGPA